MTSLSSFAQPLRLRFTSWDIHSLMWRVPDCLRRTFPVPVILKRRAAALLVFIFGMISTRIILDSHHLIHSLQTEKAGAASEKEQLMIHLISSEIQAKES